MLLVIFYYHDGLLEPKHRGRETGSEQVQVPINYMV